MEFFYRQMRREHGVLMEEGKALDTYVDVNGPYELPESFTQAIAGVLDNADNTGCSDDLTVTSHSAVEALRKIMHPATDKDPG